MSVIGSKADEMLGKADISTRHEMRGRGGVNLKCRQGGMWYDFRSHHRGDCEPPVAARLGSGGASPLPGRP